jgi:hypothetical protein
MSSYEDYNIYNLRLNKKRSYSKDYLINIEVFDFNHINYTIQTKYKNRQIIIPRCIHKYNICSPWCNFVKNTLTITTEYYPPNIYSYPEHLFLFV